MFLSDSHHRQVLSPTEYCSPEHLQVEIEQLFLPTWHLAGSLNDLPRDDSFITLEILDHPLLLWRKDGQIHGYLNVCAHRSCLLTGAAHGQMPRLKCQYHGWEYDETGNTRRIPDARSFRPMKPGIIGLQKFPTAVVGGVVFIALREDPPPIEEYLGPAYDFIVEVTSGNWQFLVSGDRQIDTNWKTVIENTVESYHVEAVHPTSLGEIPDESTCVHKFDDRWSMMTISGKPAGLDGLDILAHRLLGVERDPNFRHLLIYPHLVVAKMGLFSWVDQALPLGPNRMHLMGRAFSRTGAARWWGSGIMAYFVRRWGRRFLQQIAREDAAVLTCVQRGFQSPLQPLGGLISTREERIFHFQNYIRQATAGRACANQDTGFHAS